MRQRQHPHASAFRDCLPWFHFGRSLAHPPTCPPTCPTSRPPIHLQVALLKQRLPADVQTSRRGLLVDEHLRVRGSRGTIYCLGDAAVTSDSPAAALPPTAQVGLDAGIWEGWVGGRLDHHACACG